MAWVYILRGTSGRHYIGATRDLEARLAEHRKGGVKTTKRLGHPLELVVTAEFPEIKEAMAAERMLKSWKSPAKAIAWLEAR